MAELYPDDPMLGINPNLMGKPKRPPSPTAVSPAPVAPSAPAPAPAAPAGPPTAPVPGLGTKPLQTEADSAFARTFGVNLTELASVLHPEIPDAPKRLDLAKKMGLSEEEIAQDMVNDAKEVTKHTYVQRLSELNRQYPDAVVRAEAERNQKMKLGLVFQAISGIGDALARRNPQELAQRLQQFRAQVHDETVGKVERQRTQDIQSLGQEVTLAGADQAQEPATPEEVEFARGLGIPVKDGVLRRVLMPLIGPAIQLARASSGGEKPLTPELRAAMAKAHPELAAEFEAAKTLPEAQALSRAYGGEESRGMSGTRLSQAVLNDQQNRVTDYTKAFERDTAMLKKRAQQLSEIYEHLDAIAAGNEIAPQDIKTLFARLSGEVGNLTQAERDVYGGSQAILTRLRSAASIMATGQPLGENMAFLRDLAQRSERAIGRERSKSAWAKAQQLAKVRDRTGATFLTPEEAFDRLLPGEEPPTEDTERGGEDNQPKRTARQEELMKKYGNTGS